MSDKNSKKTEAEEKGFFDKISQAIENAIFERVEEETATAEERVKNSDTSGPVTIPKKEEPPVDAKIYETIWQASQRVGLSLVHFLGLAKKFESVVNDEATQFKSALIAANMTRGDLLEAVDEQINILHLEKEKFAQRINVESEKITELQDKQQYNHEEIEKLRKQIGNLETEQEELRVRILKEQNKIESARQKFQAASSAVEKDITAIKNKINKYL